VKRLTKEEKLMDKKQISKEILMRMVKSFTENEVAPYDMERSEEQTSELQ